MVGRCRSPRSLISGGVTDFGIGYVDELPDFAVGVPLGHETFGVVMPARHKLAGRRKLGLSDLADQTVVALPTDSRTRRTIDAAAMAGVGLRQRVAVTQIATLLALVAAEVGIGVVPLGSVRGPMGRNLNAVPLEPRLVRRIGVIRLREREPTPSGFLTMLRRDWPPGLMRWVQQCRLSS